ncbi:hypothetical protein MJ581_10350 [Escherichia coli]|nr:hypothetical protein MJ581_10350 [Escherichia coli]
MRNALEIRQNRAMVIAYWSTAFIAASKTDEFLDMDKRNHVVTELKSLHGEASILQLSRLLPAESAQLMRRRKRLADIAKNSRRPRFTYKNTTNHALVLPTGYVVDF